MADPPWLLLGEGLLAWVPPPVRAAVPLAPGLAPLPGPAAVIAMAYDDSPVGPFLELSVVVPARLGLRPGLSTVVMVVSSPEARLALRQTWGLPAEVGGLRWEASGESRSMTWEGRGVAVRARPRGPALPVLVPVRSVQWREGGAVVLPRRVRARARFAACQVDVDAEDALAWAAGPHRGMVLRGARIAAAAARRPAGVVSSVPWRERVVPSPAEPAGGAATMAGPGRMAQLVRAQPSHG